MNEQSKKTTHGLIKQLHDSVEQSKSLRKKIRDRDQKQRGSNDKR